MGNSRSTLAESKFELSAFTKALQKQKEPFSRSAQTFLEQYDEVLNKHVLHVFRKTNEEYDRAHDHRAIKIIAGELVNLRLDLLNGQADGIKVSLEKKGEPMYIWFQPDTVAGKMLFKIVCGEKRKSLRYKPEQITHDFLMDLIRKVFIPLNQAACN